jgi:hypothetical protein
VTDTVRERALVSLYARLSAIGTVAGLTTARNDPGPVTKLPRLVMFDGGHERVADYTSIDVFDLNVTISLHIAANNAAGLSPKLDELYGAAVAAFVADLSNSGNSIDAWEQGLSDPDMVRGEGVPPHLKADLEVVVRIATRKNDPFTANP